ncbi:MAG: GH36-type glycosyl hydrolase domain-containing protein, partial [Clostridium sp.]
FSIGYNVEENSLGTSYYDLLASECRIASFVAISKNDVPKSHWFNLSRAMTNAFHTHSLVSWSGTMFEYFMPSLIMRNYPKTLLDQTYKGVIKAQIVFAKQKKVPWGISESAFYEFDGDENYQYKAFGVPGLGLKRGLEDEIVISPYSTIISIPFCGKRAIENLVKIQGGGTLGRYGFIEAVDYTKAREDKFITVYDVNNCGKNVDNSVNNVDNYEKMVDKVVEKNDESSEIYLVDNVDNVDNFVKKDEMLDISTVKRNGKKQNNPQIYTEKPEEFLRESYPQDYEEIYNDGIKPNNVFTYMVHHLGMSIMSLDNVLKENILINRFHRIPSIKASELLLKEKIPNYVTFSRNEDFSIKNRYLEGEVLSSRIFKSKEGMFDEQKVLLLSNGEYSSMINICGSGYSKKNDMMIYRWNGSSTNDNSGLFFYIKDLSSNNYWSSTFEPCKTYGENYTAEFTLDKAKFSRNDGDIESNMEMTLSTEDDLEVRKITLNNKSDEEKIIEITSYCEITLTTFAADSVHPAFSNLFIQTEYVENEEILLGNRRGRVKGAKIPYIFQKIIVNGEREGDITYETSRLNFIGRNRELKNPKAMDNDITLDNTVGTVLDPILSMRVRVRIKGNEKKDIYFITGTSDSKEEAIGAVHKYSNSSMLERVFERYSIAIQLELKNLEIRSITANMFQNLSSYIFYLQSGREDRENYIKNINKHQKDLWAYGISGDLPIVFLTIEDESDINLVLNMVKFYAYMKIKGVKIDFVIYNNEEISYDEPLQKSILQVIRNSNVDNNINKAAGIFIYNKSTMSEEVKNFLIGISRIYIDSKNGTLVDHFNKCTVKHDESDFTENMYSRLNVFSEIQNVEENNLKRSSYRIDIKNKSDDLKENSEISIKEIDLIPLSIDENESDGNAINNNDINYSEYDNDVDFINSNDLIEGMKIKSCNNSKDIDSEYSSDSLDFFNGYGGFDKKDNTYVIRLSDYKNTPAPWINVVSNADFGFHISESGSSYTWCRNSRENKITPWSNDYIRDPMGEALYIRDDSDGRYFSITPKPVRDEGEYIIKHGFGYSQFMHTAYGIKGTMKVFAPKDEKVKLQIVTLENLNNENREISIFYYAKLVLGVYAYESERYISTYSVKNNSNVEYIGGNNPYSEYFGNLHAYLTIAGGKNLTVSGDAKEFIGFGGEIEAPKALNYKNLSNKTGSIYDPCLSACSKIKLKAYEKKDVVIIFGQDFKENIQDMVEKYKDISNVYDAFERVKEYWNNFLGNIQVSTPDKSMDYMLNGWLLYQTFSCRYLSRSAFYQSGGAYGFRDQLQDVMALGVVDSEIQKAQIIRSASRQYIEGDVQHWWHPVINSGIRTRFSDDLLWLPYVTAQYINSTGDYSILDMESPYLEDEPLKEGEDERYTIVNQSSKIGTIYEHCQKAIEKSLKFGEHNIPLMGSGDWNDGMSTVGNKGKGESVWLGWFLYDILNSFEEIAEYKNDFDLSSYYNKNKIFIKDNLEKYAWDGNWYRRAYFDNGKPLGSRENPECQIDSLAQSWAVISGAECKNNKDLSQSKEYTDRAVEAMEAVERNLIKKDKGIILLLAPPFNNSNLEPGYIKGYVPGVRENGGQYTHAAVWVILALTKLGLSDKAVKYYNMINPINHSKTEFECMKYKTEPYVMSADVYLKEPHGGRGGWSWYTGASGWMYRVGIENILGLQRIKDKGYEIKPCVPEQWNEYEIRLKNETENYTIKV